MGRSGDEKGRSWLISFHRTPKSQPSSSPPSEFICPINKSLMSDPVIVSSGQTFERTAVQVCKDLTFTPQFPNEPSVDFSAVIPNRNLRSAITNWCKSHRVSPPAAPDYYQVESLVKNLMNENRVKQTEPGQVGSTGSVGSRGFRSDEMELLKGVAETPKVGFSHAATEMNFRQEKGAEFYSSSEESVVISHSPGSSTPLTFATKPACVFSSSSSSDLVVEQGLSNEIVSENLGVNVNGNEDENCSEEDEVVAKLLSLEVYENEEGLIGLRKLTKTSQEARVMFCSLRLLKALKPLIVSGYAVVQVNAVASLVNLSLEKCNKLKIVRAGFVPLLIDLLKGGSAEAQELAAGAIFSLALEEDNKTAIGALGALQPLLRVLRAESAKTRCDAALALYHLSLVPSNRVKMVNLGAVSILLTLLRGKDIACRVVLVLCNLAACAEGKSAMLDGNAIGIILEMLRENAFDSEATEANLVAALYSLSYRSLRFRGMAKEAGAVEVLRMVQERGSERAKEKARRILQMMRGGGEDGEEDEAGESGGGLTRGMYRLGISGGGGGKNVSTLF